VAAVTAGHQRLVGEEVVELEHAEPARPDQPLRVEFQVLDVDQPLGVGEPRADRSADAERMPLEREEPDDLRAVAEYGNPYVVAQLADGEGELRRQERVVEGGIVKLESPPAGYLRRPELSGVDD
jgi:hypothetical protein